MKNVDSKKIMYYVLLVGVLALVIVYFLVYKKYIDKTDSLNAENRTLSDRVAVLKEYYDNRMMYEESIEAMQIDINKKLDEFPADVKEEDILLLAVKSTEDSYIAYTGVNLSDREPIYEIDRGIVGQGSIEGLSDTLTFVKRTVSYVNNVDYFNLKQVIGFILNSPNKKNISVVSYKANEDTTETAEDLEKESEIEMLDGTISVQFFSVLGSGKPYERPEIPEYEAGLFNIFGFDSMTKVDNGL